MLPCGPSWRPRCPPGGAQPGCAKHQQPRCRPSRAPAPRVPCLHGGNNATCNLAEGAHSFDHEGCPAHADSRKSLQQRCRTCTAQGRAGTFMSRCKELVEFTRGGAGGRPEGSLRHLPFLLACAAVEGCRALPAHEAAGVSREDGHALPTSSKQRHWRYSLCPGRHCDLHNRTLIRAKHFSVTPN